MSVLCVLLFVSWLFWKGEIQRFETILKNCVYCRLKLNWRAINTLFLLYPFVILLTIVAVDIQRYIWTSYSCGIYTQQNRTQRGRYPATSDSWGVLIDTCNIKSDQGQIIPNHCSIFFFAHYHTWSMYTFMIVHVIILQSAIPSLALMIFNISPSKKDVVSCVSKMCSIDDIYVLHSSRFPLISIFLAWLVVSHLSQSKYHPISTGWNRFPSLWIIIFRDQ